MVKSAVLAIACAMLLAGTARAQDQKPGATGPDPKVFQEIYNCLAPGVPAGWARLWVTVSEIDRSDDGKSRNFEAIFRYSLSMNDDEGEDLKPCDTALVIKTMGDQNEHLKPEQRSWVSVTLSYTSDGKYEMKYDYSAPKPRAKPKPGAKPAATPAAKPAAKPAPAGSADKKDPGFKLK